MNSAEFYVELYKSTRRKKQIPVIILDIFASWGTELKHALQCTRAELVKSATPSAQPREHSTLCCELEYLHATATARKQQENGKKNKKIKHKTRRERERESNSNSTTTAPILFFFLLRAHTRKATRSLQHTAEARDARSTRAPPGRGHRSPGGRTGLPDHSNSG